MKKYLLVLLFVAVAAAQQPKPPTTTSKAKPPHKSTKAVTQHGVNLTWTVSPTTTVNQQQVCRATATLQEDCANPIATIGNNTTASFLDQSGSAGTKYYYIVQACVNTVCSPSGEVSAIFPTVPQPPTAVSAVPQ